MLIHAQPISFKPAPAERPVGPASSWSYYENKLRRRGPPAERDRGEAGALDPATAPGLPPQSA